jgi:hypothetical protein
MMRSFFIFLVSFLMLASATVLAVPEKIEVPQDSWEPIFFEGINLFCKKVGWVPLRLKNVADGSMEIRVWQGFGLTPLEGVLLRRDGDTWSGFHAKDGKSLQARQLTPRSDWQAHWRQMEALGILTLPDASALPNEELFLDGLAIVVEFSDGRVYRTYHYGNPDHQQWPEARKIIQIVNLLYDQFVLTGEPTGEF